ncbi:adenosine kinase-like [Aphis craccivora]|uniref:Adenosine kinase-like n=1 Tax=Aphis craccivora TaxID=307492 RepID=A0A6G0Y5M4_APHCR|nr:adenosine kinase-like [Aphis craccivora]
MGPLGRRILAAAAMDDGRETLVVDGGLDDAAGHQLVVGYLTDWYNAPENVWRYYTEDGVCSLDIDGTKYVATGRTEIRELFNDAAAPETGNHEGGDGGSGKKMFAPWRHWALIQPWVRCPSGQLLVVATTEWFTQTFVVEYCTVAGVASVAVIASVVTVKQVGACPQTPAETPSRRAQTKTPQSPPPPTGRVEDRRRDSYI